MSLRLCFGVIDGDHGNVTTFQLAEILEGKYALFSQFVELNFDLIQDALAEDVQNQIHALMNGQAKQTPYMQASQKVETAFRAWLDAEGIVQSGVPGVPTQAALDGRNSRLKGRKGPRRPSFEDTKILRRSLRVWIDGGATA